VWTYALFKIDDNLPNKIFFEIFQMVYLSSESMIKIKVFKPEMS
jgi:hypothetical protein